jgi:hypothetical protein
MSGSSPDDLATTFRSITRRWREAQGAASDDVVADPRHDLDVSVGKAASLLGVDANPESIADAIVQRPASEWTTTQLEQLRTIALDVGALLRRASALAAEA